MQIQSFRLISKLLLSSFANIFLANTSYMVLLSIQLQGSVLPQWGSRKDKWGPQ